MGHDFLWGNRDKDMAVGKQKIDQLEWNLREKDGQSFLMVEFECQAEEVLFCSGDDTQSRHL